MHLTMNLTTSVIPKWSRKNDNYHNLNDFQKIKSVGKGEQVDTGVYGEVWMAKELKTNRIVAIKETQVDAEGILPTTVREIALLKQLNHPNIVK